MNHERIQNWSGVQPAVRLCTLCYTNSELKIAALGLGLTLLLFPRMGSRQVTRPRANTIIDMYTVTYLGDGTYS